MDHITEIRFQSHCDFLKKNIAENPAESFEKVISSTSLQKIFNEEAGQFRQRIFSPWKLYGRLFLKFWAQMGLVERLWQGILAVESKEENQPVRIIPELIAEGGRDYRLALFKS